VARRDSIARSSVSHSPRNSPGPTTDATAPERRDNDASSEPRRALRAVGPGIGPTPSCTLGMPHAPLIAQTSARIEMSSRSRGRWSRSSRRVQFESPGIGISWSPSWVRVRRAHLGRSSNAITSQRRGTAPLRSRPQDREDRRHLKSARLLDPADPHRLKARRSDQVLDFVAPMRVLGRVTTLSASVPSAVMI
jgi:hypothetical protein